MPKPVPGKNYTVADETTLSQIAARAYGDSVFWPRIFNANQFTLKSTDPDSVSRGEILIIPVLSERELIRSSIVQSSISGKDKDDLTIIVNGREIKTVGARILRTMDTASDAWKATVQWEPGIDTSLDSRLKPYAYPLAQAYIGNELLVSGLLYNTKPQLTNSGSRNEIEGFSFTADAVDSTLKPPYEKNNVDFRQRAEELIKPLGINVIFDDGVDPGGAFDRITAREGDTLFQHLLSLAVQRNFLLSSTPSGDLLVTVAKITKPVATLEEGLGHILDFNATFDGRKRFNVYRALGKSPKGNKIGIAKDNKVPRSRFVTFNANETIDGDIQKVADWRRSKQLADALTISLPVSGWYDPNGNLWRENTMVEVISPTLGIEKGFTFLIKQVEYVQENSGKTATLNIVPPQVYTGETIIEPW